MGTVRVVRAAARTASAPTTISTPTFSAINSSTSWGSRLTSPSAERNSTVSPVTYPRRSHTGFSERSVGESSDAVRACT
ncbi:MAG: hypothetical protein U1F54_23195 [Burkholderiales bacterium]